jgi:hypothetical protein
MERMREYMKKEIKLAFIREFHTCGVVDEV